MHNDLGFNGDEERAWMDEAERTQVERVRGTTRLAEGTLKRRRDFESPVPRDASAAIKEQEDEPLERVGRRHLIRPELGALVVGAVFVLAALVKPWGTVAPAPSPSASPLINDLSIIDLQGSQEPPLPPYLTDLSRGWAGVDWSFLSMTDTHGDWGISTATMAEVLTSKPQPTPHVPSVVWMPVPSATPATVLDVGPDIGVFALAVTWPADVRVTDISVEYLGSGYEPPYLTSGGFQPYTQLSPLPADTLLVPEEQPTQGAPRSGEFWVPPAIASPVTADRSAAVAWHQLPWPWPLGGYKITITSQHLPTVLALFLRQTPGTPAELTAAPTPHVVLTP
jgi:hypothetical protein